MGKTIKDEKIVSHDDKETSDSPEAGIDTEETKAESADKTDDKPAEPEEETDPLKRLETQLEEAKEESKQAHDRLLRASAEYENYKKRSARELGEFKKFANESLIKDLLSVIDNLERAIDSFNLDDNANKSVVQGVEMVLKEFYKVLEKYNLKSLDSHGKVFDPNFHQAVMQEETDDAPENTVTKVMQKGYILHDRLIRPAMVVVAKAKQKDTEEDKTEK